MNAIMQAIVARKHYVFSAKMNNDKFLQRMRELIRKIVKKVK